MHKRYPMVFAYGFRTFFLAASLIAPLLILRWLAFQLFNVSHITPYYDPVTWHAHEMIFGFAGAMIAGFLLTAVPNWTGTEAPKGLPLAILAAIWLLGRILPLYSNGIEVTICDLAFFPVLGILLAPRLIKKGQMKTLIFLPILGVLWIANALVHAQRLMGQPGLASAGLHLAISFIVLLIIVIGGRVIPFFTVNACRDKAEQQKRWPPIEFLAFTSAVLLPAFDYLPKWPVAILGFLFFVVHACRLYGWWLAGGQRFPILWILYIGYFWIALGFLLRAFASFDLVAASVSFHSFAVGGMGVVGIGIMSRASLGHTGRSLKAANVTVVAYLLITAAAVVRVGGPIVGLPTRYMLYGSGGLWILAFLSFLAVYAPILLKPRVDGRPG